MPLITFPMQRALRTLDTQRDMARLAEERRQNAWAAYIQARNHAQDAQDALHSAEQDVLREASRLAGQAPRPNRDTRRAQVYAGLSDDGYAYADPDEDLPY